MAIANDESKVQKPETSKIVCKSSTEKLELRLVGSTNFYEINF